MPWRAARGTIAPGTQLRLAVVPARTSRANLVRLVMGEHVRSTPISYVQRAQRATFISSLIRITEAGRMRLDEIAATIWRAYTDGEIDEDEARALAQMVTMSIRRRVSRSSDSPQP